MATPVQGHRGSPADLPGRRAGSPRPAVLRPPRWPTAPSAASGCATRRATCSRCARSWCRRRRRPSWPGSPAGARRARRRRPPRDAGQAADRRGPGCLPGGASLAAAAALVDVRGVGAPAGADGGGRGARRCARRCATGSTTRRSGSGSPQEVSLAAAAVPAQAGQDAPVPPGGGLAARLAAARARRPRRRAPALRRARLARRAPPGDRAPHRRQRPRPARQRALEDRRRPSCGWRAWVA